MSSQIGNLPLGSPALPTDQIPIQRGLSNNFKLLVGDIVSLADSHRWASLTGDLTINQVIPWDGPTVGTPDTGISRVSAGVLAIGNGTQGNASGTLTLAGLYVATVISTNAVETPDIELGGPNTPASAPVINVTGDNGKWQTAAIDYNGIAGSPPFRDMVLADIFTNRSTGAVEDILYMAANYPWSQLSAPIAIGATVLHLTTTLAMGTGTVITLGTITGGNFETVTYVSGTGTNAITVTATTFAHAANEYAQVTNDATHPPEMRLQGGAQLGIYGGQLGFGGISATEIGR